MKFPEFAALVRDYTGTDTVTLTDAKILRYANAQAELLSNSVAKVNPDFFGRTLTRDLEDGIREYSLPSEILSSISKVEVMIDGSTWQDIDPVDISTIPFATDETTIQARYSMTVPNYAVYGQNLVILSGLSITDVTAGIRFKCSLYPTRFANLTDDRDMSVPADDMSQGFPRQLHEILARKVSIVWKQNQDREIALTEYELNVGNDLNDALNTMRKSVEALTMVETVDNGEEY